MEFGVLELGLRNKQLLNVNTFLRVQAEDFKVKCLNTKENGLLSKNLTSLFQEWNEVFTKINNVLKNEMNIFLEISNSSNNENFSFVLAKITIQVINQLIQTLSILDKNIVNNKSKDLFQQVEQFEKNLVNNCKYFYNFLDSSFTSNKINFQNNLNINEKIINQVSIPLSNSQTLNWNEINRNSMNKVIEFILQQDFKNCEDLLKKLGLPINQVFYFIFVRSYNNKIINNILDFFKKNNIHLELCKQISFLQKIGNSFYPNITISYNSLCYSETEKIKNLFLSAYLDNSDNLKEYYDEFSCLIDKESIFNYLLICNDKKYLIEWCNNFKNEEWKLLNLPIKLNEINEKMLETCEEIGQEYIKNVVFSSLADNNVLSNNVKNKINLVLKRLYFHCDKKLRKKCLLCKSGFFALNKNILAQEKLLEYTIKVKQFDFIFWYLIQENNLKVLKNSNLIDLKVKNLLLSLFDYSLDKNNPTKILNLILHYSSYLNHENNIENINELFENNLCIEGIISILLIQNIHKYSKLSESNIIYVENKNIVKCLQNSYPIICEYYKSTIDDDLTLIDYSVQKYNLYDFLKDTIIFDIKRLFTWQVTNKFGIKDDLNQTIPNFNNIHLAKKFGIKAALNFIYYLNHGRPIEAYYHKIVEKNYENDFQKIEKIYQKVCVLAYFNCNNSIIVSSCIAFVELLKSNTNNFRFHIAIAKLIIKYAGDFIGLDLNSQHEVIGNLLKDVCFENNISSQSKILDLIVIALDRKYEKKKTQISECLNYEIAVKFAKKYSLDLPIKFLLKCIQNDDWLLMTIYIQIYEYPKESFYHLLYDKELRIFSNGCIVDHFKKAFYMMDSDEIDVYETINSNQEKNIYQTRNMLLKKINLRKSNFTNLKYKQSSPKLSSSTYSNDLSDIASIENADIEVSSITSNSICNDVPENFGSFNSPKSLFDLIIFCQKTSLLESRKSLLAASIVLMNPIPALISASISTNDFENENLFDYCCCWWFSSFNLKEKDLDLKNKPYYLDWSLEDLISMLNIALKNQINFIFFKLGLILFLDIQLKHPLIDLIDFFIEFLIEKNYHESSKKILDYIQSIKNYDEPINCKNQLVKKSCINKLCILLIDCSLRQVTCLLELHLMLNHLEMSCITETIQTEDSNMMNLSKLFQIIDCIHQTNCSIDINKLFDTQNDTEENRKYLFEIVEDLQNQEFFMEAKKFSIICELELENVILNEYLIQCKNNLENLSFWTDCISSLSKNKIKLKNKKKFLCDQINLIKSNELKCYLMLNVVMDENFDIVFDEENMNYLIQFLNIFILMEKEQSFLKVINSKNVSYSKTAHTEDFIIFEKMWLLLIKCGIKLENQVLRNYSYCLNLDKFSKVEECKKDALCRILDCLCNKNCIELACRIANLLDFQNTNLEILKICSKIAQTGSLREISFSNLELRKINDNLIKDFIEKSSSKTYPDKNPDLIIIILQNLYNNLTFGRKSLQNIILTFKLANVLHTNFDLIMDETDVFLILNKLVDLAHKNTEIIQLIKEYAQLKQITDKKLVNYVSSNLEQFLINEQENENSTLCCEENLLNRKQSITKFLVIIRLLSDPSLLGKKFLQLISVFKNEKNELNKIIELYIKAHECFTLASDIEGIATVLQKVRLLITNNLLHKNDFNSMMKLLLGIQRYSEMPYVFTILKENDRFELLLSKKVIKNTQLRIALIEFLKGDREMYPMIALNFSMHREIAELLETQAKTELKNFKLNFNSNLTILASSLELIMQELIDASESYSKAGCYIKSDSCEKIAQLVALQINFLPKTITLINMNETEVNSFINNHFNFFEAHIVADAYNFRHNWCTALFNHIIINGNWEYYRDYITYYKLSKVQFEEVMGMYNKLRKEKSTSIEKNSAIKQNVQKFIMLINDMKLMYKYSVEFNLVTVSSSLMGCSNVGYILDLKRQNKI